MWRRYRCNWAIIPHHITLCYHSLEHNNTNKLGSSLLRLTKQGWQDDTQQRSRVFCCTVGYPAGGPVFVRWSYRQSSLTRACESRFVGDSAGGVASVRRPYRQSSMTGACESRFVGYPAGGPVFVRRPYRQSSMTGACESPFVGYPAGGVASVRRPYRQSSMLDIFTCR